MPKKIDVLLPVVAWLGGVVFAGGLYDGNLLPGRGIPHMAVGLLLLGASMSVSYTRSLVASKCRADLDELRGERQV